MTTRWKIPVTGATDKVGGQLVQVGANVRAVVRNPDAVAFPTGVEADEARALIHGADIAAVALFDHTGQFTSQPETDAVYEITGRVPRSIRQWVLDHAEAFR